MLVEFIVFLEQFFSLFQQVDTLVADNGKDVSLDIGRLERLLVFVLRILDI